MLLPQTFGISRGIADTESFVAIVPAPGEDAIEELIECWMRDPDVPRLSSQMMTLETPAGIAFGFDGTCELRLSTAAVLAETALKGYGCHVGMSATTLRVA